MTIAVATPADVLNALEDVRARLAALPAPARDDEAARCTHLIAVIETTDRVVRDPAICVGWYKMQAGDHEQLLVERLEAICGEIVRMMGDKDDLFSLMAELGESDAEGLRGFRNQTLRSREQDVQRLARRRDQFAR